jgi:hypothetical protein
MEDDGISYGHFVLFTVFGYILWIFGIVRGNLVYFCTKKYLATLPRPRNTFSHAIVSHNKRIRA